MAAIPIFYPSEVASLLERNPFKTKEESLLRVMGTIPKFRPLIAKIKQETGLRTEREYVEDAPTHIKDDLEKAVRIVSSSAVDGTQVSQTIRSFQEETTKKLLTEALSGTPISIDFQKSAARIQSGVSTLEVEAKIMQATPAVTAITREIQKQRGTRLEASSEDAFGRASGSAVTNRGDPVRFESETYCLAGYVDGMQNGKVVETKNRKRFWNRPPEYDFVQLRCYMAMKGGVDGMLVEHFPGKETPRVTQVVWDLKEWETIHTGLTEIAQFLSTMNSEVAETVIRKGLTKTN